MKVLIYGAGVIGMLYSGKLADAGHKATVVARGQRLGGPGRSLARKKAVNLSDVFGPNCLIGRSY